MSILWGSLAGFLLSAIFIASTLYCIVDFKHVISYIAAFSISSMLTMVSALYLLYLFGESFK